MAGPAKKKGVHWAVQAWVFFHLFMIFSWTVPDPPDRISRQMGYQPAREIEQGVEQEPLPKPSFGQRLRDVPNYYLFYNRTLIKDSPLRYYVLTTGFWQSWNMFSPNPANVDVYMDAIVTYQDGAEMRFKYPVMQELTVTERYFKERYRKFVENTHLDMFSYKWPAIAQSIAYQSYQGDGNFPIKVTLRRHFKTIVPINPIPPPDAYNEPEYRVYPFFEYMVDLEKLKEQAH